MPTRKVLFLCTGNFYRSRFAEELFNHLAAKKGLEWAADSRGLVKNFWLLGNYGPISPLAVKELEKRSVQVNQMRFPKHLERGEAEHFERVIALNQEEHQPYILEDYPELSTTVTYWDIKDLGDEPTESALGRLAAKIEALMAQLEAEQGR